MKGNEGSNNMALMNKLISDEKRKQMNYNGTINGTVALFTLIPAVAACALVYNLFFTSAGFSTVMFMASAVVSIAVVVGLSVVFPIYQSGKNFADAVDEKASAQKSRIIAAVFSGIIIGLLCSILCSGVTLPRDKNYASSSASLTEAYEKYGTEMEALETKMKELTASIEACESKYTRNAAGDVEDTPENREAYAASGEAELIAQYNEANTRYNTLIQEAGSKLESVKVPTWKRKFFLSVVPMILVAGIVMFLIAPLIDVTENSVVSMVNDKKDGDGSE